MADIVVAANQQDGNFEVRFTVTGSAGSVRKGTRTILVRAKSN